MPRLLFGNFDFEESLIRPDGYQRSQHLERILAELAATWTAVVRQDDLIWCPGQVDGSFAGQLRTAGWPPFRFVRRREDIPADCEFVPWGWTDEAVAFGNAIGASVGAPPLESVRAVNSRQFAFDLERSFGVQVAGSAVASTWDELVLATEPIVAQSRTALIKTEFSQAGRDRFLANTRDDVGHRLQSWARRQWDRGQRLYVEPWLAAVAEVGMQFEISRDGDVSLLGLAETIPSAHGGYAGSVVESDEVQADASMDRWSAAIAINRQAAQAIADRGYFGPLGIDAMQYRADDGRIALRPIQDVNARWTMGRLSLGLRRCVPAGSIGRWLHGPALDVELHRESSQRIIPTSPTTIDGQPVRHQTALGV